MKHRAGWTLLILLAAVPGVARSKKPLQTSWGYVPSGPVVVYARPSAKNPGALRLGRGALVALFETKARNGGRWAEVGAVDPATLEPVQGWVDASLIQTFPLEAFPADAQLLEEMGGEYLQDFAAEHTEFARYLVKQGGGKVALVCFLGSASMPQARLQVFEPGPGKFRAGPHLEFPFSDLNSGVTSVEVRGLAGAGECLITREPFRFEPRNEGVNLVIRQIHGAALQTLWKAPLQFINLASFPPRIRILEPLEKNIGAPGTVTEATVDFQERSGVRVPVWKGTIEFHIQGREAPLQTRHVEKVCPWTGSEFAPVE